MADVGADPAFVYAFQRTGVYVCLENESRLSARKRAMWSTAIDEYYEALAKPTQ